MPDRNSSTIFRRLFRRDVKHQSTWIHCPTCGTELIERGWWLGPDPDHPEIERYECSTCQTFSRWNFEMPAPILLSAIPQDQTES